MNLNPFDWQFELLQESKVHIFGLNWKQEQYVRQYLTGIKADHSELGSDFFIRKEHLTGLINHLKEKEQ